MNKRSVLILAFCLFSSILFAQTKRNQATLDYIEKYKSIAVDKMQQHRIPASITLAQGILESGSGNSELTRQSNNHFGIKCYDWTGEKVYHDDDIKDDCFRKYAKAEESFEDHSKFLKKPRYASLFELEITDYKGWAKGLKQCGYATDPKYADRLITLIETYELTKYDTASGNDSSNSEDKQKKEDEVKVEDNYLSESSMGSIPVGTNHKVVKVEGRKAVIASRGDTYESIAKEFGLRKWEIRWYNKVKKGSVPEVGQTVYIRKW